MNRKRLLNSVELEDSAVVANCCMNRERDLYGTNGYGIELGFDPLEWLQTRLKRQRTVSWLDLCCGSGKALIQAATLCGSFTGHSVRITGIDLAGMFLPNKSIHLQLLERSVFDYQPTEQFDLVTCVHGMHYIGDKLQAIRLASSWLISDGCFAANLDATNMCLVETGKGQRRILRYLRNEGFQYSAAKHLLQCTGTKDLELPFRFLGADDSAGPNYTKQPVVDSYYEEW